MIPRLLIERRLVAARCLFKGAPSTNIFAEMCMRSFGSFGYMWADCNVTWKMTPSSSRSVACASLWMSCWSRIMLQDCGFLREGLRFFCKVQRMGTSGTFSSASVANVSSDIWRPLASGAAQKLHRATSRLKSTRLKRKKAKKFIPQNMNISFTQVKRN